MVVCPEVHSRLLLLAPGTFITEWDDGALACETFLKDEESYRAVADQLVQICYCYGFDGWLINIENSLSVSHILLAVAMVKYKHSFSQSAISAIPHVQFETSLCMHLFPDIITLAYPCAHLVLHICVYAFRRSRCRTHLCSCDIWQTRCTSRFLATWSCGMTVSQRMDSCSGRMNSTHPTGREASLYQP